MDNGILHIKDLAIGYKQTLVKNINCNLNSGDFCVLFGANGKGKSTLLKTIRGTIAPIKGKVQFDGKEINVFSDKELAKIISIVSTNTNFSPDLTVQDILSFGRIPYVGMFSKLSESDISIIKKYVVRLDLNTLTDKKFIELSDGQKQRVLICRALIQDTPIILLDEPTAHLDVENRIKIFELLKQVTSEENKTVICSTHEIENGLAYANKVWMIDKDGEFVSGSISDFDKDAVLKALFS